jgi:hypothetical protein
MDSTSFDQYLSQRPSLPGGNITDQLAMCFHTIFLCGFCSAQVGYHFEPTCHPRMRQAPDHQLYSRRPSYVYPPVLYACPNRNCMASTQLHWALRNQQQAAMRQGKANMNYVPFHDIKAQCNDTSEACNFALDNHPSVPSYNAQAQCHETDGFHSLTSGAVGGYPPQYVQSARVGPAWLSYKQWCMVLHLRSRGKNILQIADAVGKNASMLRYYMDTYLKNISTHDSGVGTLSSSSSIYSSSQSSADPGTGSDDELFPLGNEVMIPEEGAPDPSFLNRSEQELVWKMFQQNETYRSMAERLHKNRGKITKYINAYMRHRLLELQDEEQKAEGRIAGTSTHIAPLTGSPPRPLISETTIIHPSETAPVVKTPPRLLREPSLHSINELDLELELIDPMLHDPTPDVTNESPKNSRGSDPPTTPKGTSTEDSLFGDSPVDNNYEGFPLGRTGPTHKTKEPAGPSSSKRKCDDDEMQPELQRASKRPRHHSLP